MKNKGILKIIKTIKTKKLLEFRGFSRVLYIFTKNNQFFYKNVWRTKSVKSL